MRTELELILNFEFEASHSLAGHELPHSHLWKLEVTIKGNPVNGRIIDIVLLRERIQKSLEVIKHQYLNKCDAVDETVREFPTCETLSHFFLVEFHKLLKMEFAPQNPTVRLTSVKVALCEMNGQEMGAAKCTPLE